MADRPASVSDVHRIGAGMPHVTVYPGSEENPVYQVGGKLRVLPQPSAGRD